MGPAGERDMAGSFQRAICRPAAVFSLAQNLHSGRDQRTDQVPGAHVLLKHRVE
jgi:hypothetical protein